MKSWLVILGLWAMVGLYWRQHGMARDLRAAREWLFPYSHSVVDTHH